MKMNHITYISAGAGSGKTYTLTTFLADLISNKGVKPEDFILTTFTTAAADEFKEKARAKLYEYNNPQAAERLNQAMIGTVDSVAEKFVKEYWYRLGISPNAKVLDEDIQNFFISQNLELVITAAEKNFLKEFTEDFEIGYPFGSGKFGTNYDFWKEDVKDLMSKSKSFDTDMNENLKASLDYAESILSTWPLLYDKNDNTVFMALLDEMEVVNNASKEGPSRTGRDKKIKEYKHKFSTGAGYLTYQKFYKALGYDTGKPELAGYKNCQHYEAAGKLVAHIYDTQEVKDKVIAYIKLIFDVVNRLTEKYTKYKREQHAIDFVDMENYFLKLLNDEPEVREDIKENFRYVFVDEFQDSSPTQVKIFEQLAAIVGRDEDDNYEVTIGENTFKLHNSVWVGDFKQAIYGFRGADTALTKAVADIIKTNMAANPKQFSMHSLDKSHRSYKDLVYKTDEIFEHSFTTAFSCDDKPELTPDEVHLEYVRNQPSNYTSLRTWTLDGNADENALTLCDKLEKLVLKTGNPSKIAVLARKKNDYTDILKELKNRNIPVSVENEIDVEADEVQLVISLLRLVINPYDSYSRALVTFLTEKDFDAGKVIDSKLSFNDEYTKAKDSGAATYPEYLSDKSIIKLFMEKKTGFSSQTIHSLVESLIIELDLFNVCRNWENGEVSDLILQSIIDAAGKYEEICETSAIPPTISGYIDFITDDKNKNLKTGGSKNGITFMTIHKSKGLEWDHVILLSLKQDESEKSAFIKHNVFGVSNYHNETPTSENLYPPMILNLFPGIITGNYGIPDCISQKMISPNSERYKEQLKSLVSEVRRLWYVAITRARDTLILVKNTNRTSKPFAALELIGVPNGWDNGFIEDDDTLKDGEQYTVVPSPILSLNKVVIKDKSKRNIQPSGFKAEKLFTPVTVYKSGERISFGKVQADSNVIGSCIHDIYCVLEHKKVPETCEKVIDGYDLKDVLTDSVGIIKAWDNLMEFLKNEYGEVVSSKHEVNFTQLDDGHIVNGSIDYIYKTAKGIVLVDFKSFPGKESDIINEGKHCAANYSGQFQCYQNALEAMGENVIARLVYYPVGGLVVKLD